MIIITEKTQYIGSCQRSYSHKHRDNKLPVTRLTDNYLPERFFIVTKYALLKYVYTGCIEFRITQKL